MNITTVAELNKYLKRSFDSNEILNDIWIKGEISNFKLHFSGHMYFTLKDESSALKCVMFKSSAAYMKFIPSDGMKVVCHGRITVFERDGSYQLYPDSMIPDGVGDLYIAYEKLKQKLESEGLFDEKYKKPLPLYPKKIGVVTSPTGAAVRDIINVLSRRCKRAEILIFPVQVQGEGAGKSIADMIDKINRNHSCDVIITGRGGGSIEDLWAFNEEIVARSVFASEIPVVSAVGHETDFTIVDFVSDMRAPTPSAAAEIVVRDDNDIKNSLMLNHKTLTLLVSDKIKVSAHLLKSLTDRPVFKDKTGFIDNKREYLGDAVRQLYELSSRKKEKSSFEFVNIISKLEALNPLAIMKRGYSSVSKNGKIIKSSAELKENDIVNLRFFEGDKNAKIIG